MDVSEIKDYITDDVYEYCVSEKIKDIDTIKKLIEKHTYKYKPQNEYEAIDFLRYEDPTLNESLCIAHKHGYKANELNSITLALFLINEKVEQQLDNIAKTIFLMLEVTNLER